VENVVSGFFIPHAWSNRLRTALKVAGPLALPVAGMGLLYFLQDHLVFNPARAAPIGGAVVPSHRKRAVVLPMRDGTRLRGWWYRPERGCAAPAPGVVYFGGRNEEVSWVSGVVPYFEGTHLLAVNYRGYGDSEGRASETALCADALELCDWLKSRPGVDPTRIAVVGRSLGSGVAAFVAAHRQLAAAVLITPYDSILEVARRRFPFAPLRFLLRYPFESVRLARAARAPLLALMSERDCVVPHAHTYRLLEAWQGDKQSLCIAGSDHCDVQLSPQSWHAVREFLNRHFARPSAYQRSRLLDTGTVYVPPSDALSTVMTAGKA
jgi:dienelactone hydrolase